MYLVEYDTNCNITAVIDCQPPLAEQGIRVLSQGGLTMSIQLGRSGTETGNWGTVNWEDGSPDSTMTAIQGQSFATVSHAYTSSNIAAFWRPVLPSNFYVTTNGQTVNRLLVLTNIKGFVSTPLTLNSLSPMSFQFNTCYFTSLANININAVTGWEFVGHSATFQINSTTLPPQGLCNNNTSLNFFIVNGNISVGRPSGPAGGSITSINLDLTSHRNCTILRVFNSANLPSISMTLQTTIDRVTNGTYSYNDSSLILQVQLGGVYLIEFSNNPSLTSINLTNLSSLSEANSTNPVFVGISLQSNGLSGNFSTNLPTRTKFLLLAFNLFTQVSCTFPSNNFLDRVHLDNNRISSLSTSIQNSSGLLRLQLGYNRLITIPNLPNSITYLSVNNNSNNSNAAATLRLTTLPTLPANLQTLVLGVSDSSSLTVGDITTYGRCNFSNFLTTTVSAANYLTNTNLNTFTAMNCGITQINLSFPPTIRTINLSNSSVSDSLSTSISACLNTLTTLDFSKFVGATSIDVSSNRFLTSITNINSLSTTLQTLKINNCYNSSSPNLQNLSTIFGTGNGLSIIPNILTLELNRNIFNDISNFSFGGVNNNSVTLDFRDCNLNTSQINAIIENLYTNYFNTTTNTITKSSWTVKFGSTTNGTVASANGNCNRSSTSNTAFLALTNTATAGAWTIEICGTTGNRPCRTTGC